MLRTASTRLGGRAALSLLIGLAAAARGTPVPSPVEGIFVIGNFLDANCESGTFGESNYAGTCIPTMSAMESMLAPASHWTVMVKEIDGQNYWQERYFVDECVTRITNENMAGPHYLSESGSAESFVDYSDSWYRCNQCLDETIMTSDFGMYVNVQCNATEIEVKQECPKEQDNDLIPVMLGISAGGCALSGIFVAVMMYFTRGQEFEDHSGVAFWGHLIIHSATAALTIAMQIVIDNYQQIATWANFRLTLKLGYWRMNVAFDGITEAGAKIASQLPDVTVGIHCCMGWKWGEDEFYMGDMDGATCTKMRIMQGTSVIVIVLAFIAAVAIIFGRIDFLGWKRWGYFGRLVFVASSVVSLVGVMIMADMRSDVIDGGAAESQGMTLEGGVIYETGFYLYFSAMLLKMVAVLLLLYEKKNVHRAFWALYGTVFTLPKEPEPKEPEAPPSSMLMEAAASCVEVPSRACAFGECQASRVDAPK